MDSNANAHSTANAKSGKLRALINQVLGSPMQLRLLLTTMFGVWYFALYSPLTVQIDGHVQRTEKERKRLETALEIERLAPRWAGSRVASPRTANPTSGSNT